MTTKLKGAACGIGAAISYGLNPLGALPMYDDGVNTNTVLFYRYALAALLLTAYMAAGRKSFAVSAKELIILAPLGVLFALSSLTLFGSFHFMDAGVACTLLFVYPVMVAVIMAVFFKEKITTVTLLSILLALSGIALLYQGADGATLSLTGVALVAVSALTYAVYIIIVNKSPLRISSVKLTFYVLLFGILTIIVFALTGGESARLQMLGTPRLWLLASLLAVFPTVVSLLLMTVAVHIIGSTPTAVLGALEPLTAVVLGVVVFGEVLTPRLATGIVMILTAVMLIIAGGSLRVNRITMVVGRLGKMLVKHWRWRQ